MRTPSRTKGDYFTNPTLVLAALIALRVINALWIQTFFQPDEYFQSLEPAWLMAFGPEASPWITWEWKLGLRSSLHPRLFALTYWAADAMAALLGLSTRSQVRFLLAVPKLTQGVLAALGDWYTWRLCDRVYINNGSSQEWLPSSTVLLLTIVSPWQWYVSTRTFSNSLETVLTVAALFYWPWRLYRDGGKEPLVALKQSGEVARLRVSLMLAAVAVVLRPTNILIWVTLALVLLTRLTFDGQSPLTPRVWLVLVREAVVCGLLVLAASAISDRQFYGVWAFPPLTFVQINVSQAISEFYGTNPWHYYLVQGVPLLTFGALPFVVRGIQQALSTRGSNPRRFDSNILRSLTLAAIVPITALSCVAHKEVRFIYPVLPILHVLAAPSAARVLRRRSGRYFLLHAVFIIAHVVIAVYLAHWHAAAPVSVLDFLRDQWEAQHPEGAGSRNLPRSSSLFTSNNNNVAAIGETSSFGGTGGNALGGGQFVVFLTPCHTTPWRSHLVYAQLTGRALTCEPPLETAPNSRERADYVSETEQFYGDIEEFLGRRRGEQWSLGWGVDAVEAEAGNGEKVLPRYIVGFTGVVEAAVHRYFETGAGQGWNVALVERWRGWNGLFSDDWRREGSLVAWEVITR